jgi:hypothetical protein
MFRRTQRPQRGINSHVNATRGHMDQPGPGFADRGSLTDLKSPLPDIRLAGVCGNQSVSRSQVPVWAINFRLLASPTVQLA